MGEPNQTQPGGLLLGQLATLFQQVPAMEQTIADRDALIAKLQAETEAAKKAMDAALTEREADIKARVDPIRAELDATGKLAASLERQLGETLATVAHMKAKLEKCEAALGEAHATLIAEKAAREEIEGTHRMLCAHIRETLLGPVGRHGVEAPADEVSLLRVVSGLLDQMRTAPALALEKECRALRAQVERMTRDLAEARAPIR